MSESAQLPFIRCESCGKDGPAHRSGTSDELKVATAVGMGWIERQPGVWVCPDCQSPTDTEADVNQTAARIVREATEG